MGRTARWISVPHTPTGHCGIFGIGASPGNVNFGHDCVREIDLAVYFATEADFLADVACG